ncbi:MAG: glycoside hydrolase family 25 protein [Lachnospiraceae bacterium]|nr:glycoside hydrolase family 25 protein [Lachnospiraceae bacterium]
MQRKRIKTLHTIIILLIIVTIMALTFAGILGALYVKEVGEVSRLQNEKEQLLSEQALPAVSLDVTGTQEISSTQSGESIADLESANEIATSGEERGENAAQISELMQSKEDEIEQSIKDKMKTLVTSENGSPLKMLRSFFPENLIYYYEDEYVFAPVLEGVRKHTLLDENFVKTDDDQMQYVDNGTVISHKGIDVSKYQGEIDWNAVKADGVEYAFIRLGLRGYESGKLVLDDYFADNMTGANDAGVMAGVYFFTQAVTVDEAKEEAEFVIQNMAGYDVPYPVVFDVELITNADGRADNLTKEERTDITIAFCEAVKAAGYTPMIYGNIVCFTQLLDMTRLNDYDKWYAFYDDYMYMPYDVSCWQYTESGTVSGIKGKVDLNISYKTW